MTLTGSGEIWAENFFDDFIKFVNFFSEYFIFRYPLPEQNEVGQYPSANAPDLLLKWPPCDVLFGSPPSPTPLTMP